MKKKIVFLPIFIIAGLILASIFFNFYKASHTDCVTTPPMSFIIEDENKSSTKIAQEVFSKYLDYFKFPSSCPETWIFGHHIDSITPGVDDNTWAINYTVSPFPGNAGYYLGGNGELYPTGQVGKFKIMVLSHQGKKYTIVRLQTGG
jgi:hypothetical protein